MTTATVTRSASRAGARPPRPPAAEIENPYDPADSEESPLDNDEPSELDDIDGASIDDADWDVFVADDDEFDPLPDPGDFWTGE